VIDAVLFDFFGTLVRPAAGAPSYEEIFAGFGYRADPSVLRTFYDHPDFVDHREHSASEAHYRAWTRQRLEQLCRTVGVDDDDVAAVLAGLEAASRYDVEAYPEAAEVLAAVGEAGVAVAVCSNWGWHLDPLLEAAGLSGVVDLAVTSARVGVRKPHPDIYQHTLDRLGVDPGAAVFVGDTWLPDVEGPLLAGVRGAVHVERADGVASPACPPGGRDGTTPRARCVPDLRPVLDLLAS
jgi:putative hydrolase of the HAD superfamily